MQKKLHCNIHELMLTYIWVCQFNFFKWKIFCVNFSVNLPLKKSNFISKDIAHFFVLCMFQLYTRCIYRILN